MQADHIIVNGLSLRQRVTKDKRESRLNGTKLGPTYVLGPHQAGLRPRQQEGQAQDQEHERECGQAAHAGQSSNLFEPEFKAF